jgi:NitT/TauT family transport system permease protein
MSDITQSEAGLASLPRAAPARGERLLVARILFLAAIVALWQGAVALGLADAAFVSTPADVARSLWRLFATGEILPDLATTLLEIVLAFLLSVVLGVASAVVLDRNAWFNRVISPFLTALNSMPRIALGPLFVLWFGIGIASKIVLAVSLGYFIMLLSTLGGLKTVDRDLLLMSRLFGASQLALFRHVRLPWAVPGVFAGLKLTLIYCSAGAVIGEMIAAKSGLGLLVQTLSGSFNIAGVMALILVVAVMVMILTSLVEWCERALLAWSRGSTDLPR